MQRTHQERAVRPQLCQRTQGSGRQPFLEWSHLTEKLTEVGRNVGVSPQATTRRRPEHQCCTLDSTSHDAVSTCISSTRRARPSSEDGASGLRRPSLPCPDR